MLSMHLKNGEFAETHRPNFPASTSQSLYELLIHPAAMLSQSGHTARLDTHTTYSMQIVSSSLTGYLMESLGVTNSDWLV